MSNDRATKYANCVADISGDENIAEMWKNYFASLYNSVNDGGSKDTFLIVSKLSIIVIITVTSA